MSKLKKGIKRMPKKNNFEVSNLRDHRIRYLSILLNQTRDGDAEEIGRMLRALDSQIDHLEDLKNRPFAECESRSHIGQHVSINDIDCILWTFNKHLYAYACPELRTCMPDNAHLKLSYDGKSEIGELSFILHLIDEGED